MNEDEMNFADTVGGCRGLRSKSFLSVPSAYFLTNCTSTSTHTVFLTPYCRPFLDLDLGAAVI